MPGSQQGQPGGDTGRRNVLGYAIAGALSIAIIAAVVIAVAAGGESDAEEPPHGDVANAHLQPLIGVVPEDAVPDSREGTPPPALAEGDLEAAAAAAKCELQLDLPDDGNTHFLDEDREVKSSTNPPNSGDHYGAPTETASGALADGAYLNAPPMARAVHALEHGRVAIQYSSDLPEKDQLALKGVFDESPEGMLFFPNDDMPYDVAVVAWTDLAGCETYEGAATLDLIRDFRDIYRGNGPEAVPINVAG